MRQSTSAVVPRRFLGLPPDERSRTVEAAVWLLCARLALGLLPFRWALAVFRLAPGHATEGRVADDEATAVGRAVMRAARHVPFRAVCIQQSFAALAMLRRRGLSATVRLGLARGDDGLAAHAWSLCGDVAVTGGAAADGYTPVATFTSRRDGPTVS